MLPTLDFWCTVYFVPHCHGWDESCCLECRVVYCDLFS